MATTPLDPRVISMMSRYLGADGCYGNASSAHAYGLEAKAAVEQARHQVARLIHADSDSIVWTSGATEAINLALKGAAEFYKRKGQHIITCATEHKAVLNTCRYLERQGYEITILPVAANGLIDLNKLAQAFRRDTVLVSIAHVNNEIGVIQDIATIGAMTRAKGILLHVDAAQSLGKIPLDVRALKIDLLSMAAHKVYGPKGCGALYISSDPKIHLVPQMTGSGQEGTLRSGTLAVHQIVGFGEACNIAEQEMANEHSRLLLFRDRLWSRLKHLPGVMLNGDAEKRIANNLNISFPNIQGEALHAALERYIAVSAGAACSRHSIEPSHVLLALGLDESTAHASLRISIGRFTTDDEMLRATDAIMTQVTRLQAISPL